ncbi:MAG: hypothetical protein JXQ96_04155 [Cyclobacteriaceae bacterium]
MPEELLKYLTIYSSSTVKFIFGPLIGAANGYSVFVTGTLTLLGTMTSVYIFTLFGDRIRTLANRLLKSRKKRVFTKRNRQFVTIWNKYGIMGIAFLTPILLTPIGGTIAANALGCRKQDIFRYMWMSAVFWSYTLTWVVKFARDLLFFV